MNIVPSCGACYHLVRSEGLTRRAALRYSFKRHWDNPGKRLRSWFDRWAN